MCAELPALVHHPESVAILAVEGDALIVVRQTRRGARSLTIELPAGCLEPGEDPHTAAERELREECSLRARTWRAIGSFWAAPSYSTERVHVFEAREFAPAYGVLDLDEDITVERRALSALPEALSDATSIAAFALWVAADRSG